MTFSNKNLSFVFGIAICGSIFALPFSKNVSNIFILISCFIWMMEGEIVGKLKEYFNEPVYAWLGALYVLYVFGMVFTTNVSVGLFNLEKKYTLLAIPLTLGTTRLINKKWIDYILCSFVASTIIAALFCLIDVTIKFINGASSAVFFHEELSMILDFQPPYFSTFVLFSIYILAAKNKLAGEKLKLVTRLILIVFLVVILILLSSRMTLFFGFISAVVYSIIWIHRRKLYWRGLVAGIFMLGISLWLLTNIPLVKERFKEPFRTDFSVIDGGGETTLSIRWIKWKCSIKGILDSPFFGTGTGDSIDYLVSCYEKEKFWGMYPQYRFNSHNQYLELTLTLGLGALFILFYIFYRAFKTAIIRKNNLYFIFLLLVSFVCLTESFLERQWGLVFFVLFISLFSKSSKIDSAYV